MTNRLVVSVGPVAIEISAIDAHDVLAHQPYAIGTNLWMREGGAPSLAYSVVVEEGDGPLQITRTASSLTIRGNRMAERADGYNRQFALFGNKGIVQQFFIHLLEQNDTAIFHAAAVVHPVTGRVLIGMGPTGSGKTAFVCSALEAGWRLVASELVLVDTGGRLYAGNRLDNMPPGVQAELATRLPAAIQYVDRRLVEPIGQKFLVDLTPYADSAWERLLSAGSYDIVVLAFGRLVEGGELTLLLRNNDFVRRVLQRAACEKAVQAPVFDSQLFPVFDGAPTSRADVVEGLLAGARRHTLIGGSMANFRSWNERTFVEEA